MTAKHFIRITEQLFDSVNWGFRLADNDEDDQLIRWGIAFQEAKAIIEAWERGERHVSEEHGNTPLTHAVERITSELSFEPSHDEDGGLSDVEADADTLRMAGWGTDEDYFHFEREDF